MEVFKVLDGRKLFCTQGPIRNCFDLGEHSFFKLVMFVSLLGHILLSKKVGVYFLHLRERFDIIELIETHLMCHFLI